MAISSLGKPSTTMPLDSQEWSSQSPEDIGNRTLGESIVDRLADAILSGRIKPGDRLFETDLARRFGVSRGPVRDAIRRLQEEGIVQKSSHLTAFVRERSIQELQDLVSYRAALESLAARVAAERRSKSDLSALQSFLLSLRTAAAGGDVHILVSADLAFHMAVAQASHHTYVISAMRRLKHQIQLFMLTEKLSYGPVPLRRSIKHHERILTSIVGQRPAAAADAMRTHVLGTMEALAIRAEKDRKAQVAAGTTRFPAERTAGSVTHPRAAHRKSRRRDG